MHACVCVCVHMHMLMYVYVLVYTCMHTSMYCFMMQPPYTVSTVDRWLFYVVTTIAGGCFIQ